MNEEVTRKIERKPTFPTTGGFSDQDRLLALLPLRPYQVIADVGPGPEYLSLALAKYLYDGQLYVVGIRKGTLEIARQTLKPFRFTNVEFLQGRGSAIPLPAKSLDGAIFASPSILTRNTKAVLTSVKALLGRGGWMAIGEWDKNGATLRSSVASRPLRDELREEAERVGFRLLTTRRLNDQQYLMIFGI